MLAKLYDFTRDLQDRADDAEQNFNCGEFYQIEKEIPRIEMLC